MGKIKRRTWIVLAVIAVVLIISVPIYLNYFFRSTTAPTEKLILSSNDLPGWTQTDHTDTPKEDLLISGVQEWSYSTFHNSSVDNGTDLAISVISFQSNDAARHYYDSIATGTTYSLVKNVNKAENTSCIIIRPDPSNLNISLPYLSNDYYLVMNNVAVRMGFQYVSLTSTLVTNHISDARMNDIVEHQIDKINHNMTNFF